ncbi:NAD(P)(+) transhydrogenase (Re/Si-specific) subunit beta [Salisaeta longa]|uniref:NAD(P)(+) transhydrogenase (Re/Si-specific) subunit beta n=1 Tax=Salisaeta longa TaxID=503170 RepID=UPI0003B3F1BF|nr:NAD(P)(+) transhydrogenase (Re/Si-specific) subunit beta [Salisaeta longa]
MERALIDLAYVAAAILFILGLKRMQSPVTARVGNALAASGMLVAVVATLFLQEILSWPMIVSGLALGGAVGGWLSQRVEMTDMPELVAVFNGFGGGASALVAGAEVARYAQQASVLNAATVAGSDAFVIGLSILIGTVTFSGSFVAYGKLSGRLSGQPLTFPGMRGFTIGMLLVAGAALVQMTRGAGGLLVEGTGLAYPALALCLAALALGVLLVVPIGGADMPVVVSLLNSYSGLAATATGFVLNNTALIVSGTLVGAAGMILTVIMCDAMNRSLANVMLGGFGGDGDAPGAIDVPEGKTVQETSPDDTAILTSYAEQVIIVPGYGLAVAQAQHAVRELADLLQEQGITVKYAIHPVAGRMPGHMNVLLAEANVPYEQLYEMDEINPEFSTTDVALVIGANDVVNPAARTDEGSPIYGMPILNVDEAETVVVFKRSLSPGYSGVQNDLFFADNTKMLFGDAKETVSALVDEVKALQAA